MGFRALVNLRKWGGMGEQAMLAWGQAQDTPGGVPCSSSSSIMGCVESACERMVQTGLSTVKYATWGQVMRGGGGAPGVAQLLSTVQHGGGRLRSAIGS